MARKDYTPDELEIFEHAFEDLNGYKQIVGFDNEGNRTSEETVGMVIINASTVDRLPSISAQGSDIFFTAMTRNFLLSAPEARKLAQYLIDCADVIEALKD